MCSSKSRLYVCVCMRRRSCFVCAFLFNCQKQFTNFITKLCASRINLSIRHHSTRPPEKLLKVQHCFFVYIYVRVRCPEKIQPPTLRLCLVAFNIVGSFLLFTLKDIQLLKAHSFPPPTPLPCCRPATPVAFARENTPGITCITPTFSFQILAATILANDKRPFVIFV